MYLKDIYIYKEDLWNILMPIEFKIKVVAIGDSLRVTIPKEICEALKIKRGDTVAMTTNNSEIIIRKAK